jgi:predicted PurR-regulated permease PerM
MADQDHSSQGTQFLFVMAALVIIIWGFTLAQSVIVLLLVSVFLAVLGTPQVLWLRRKRVPSVLAVLIVICGMIAVLLIAGVVVGASLADFTDSLPAYQTRLQEQVQSFKIFLASRGIENVDKILTEYVDLAALMRLTASLLSGLGSALSNIFLILLIVTFILMEASSFPSKLKAAFGSRLLGVRPFMQFMDDINHYVFVKTGVSVSTGVLIGVWLAILGVDFPVLWGFLSFLLNYVPSLGVVIAAVPAVLLALVQYGLGRALLVAVGYLAVNIVVGTILEPRIVGRGVGLSTLVVFLSLILWGSIFGLVGMVLCVPITMTLKFALETNEQTRWLAVLLGREPSTGEVEPHSKS